MFLLDGIVIGREKTLEFDTSLVEKGIHTLRVVGYSTGLVKSQVFTVTKLMVKNSKLKVKKVGHSKASMGKSREEFKTIATDSQISDFNL